MSLPQHPGRGKRVNLCVSDNIANGNELVRSLRDGQQSRSLGEGGNAMSGIESRFEFTRNAHQTANLESILFDRGKPNVLQAF
jgi:hypothetical protein